MHLGRIKIRSMENTQLALLLKRSRCQLADKIWHTFAYMIRSNDYTAALKLRTTDT